MSSKGQFHLPFIVLILAQVGCQSVPLMKPSAQTDKRVDTLSRRVHESEKEIEFLRSENLILRKKLAGSSSKVGKVVMPVLPVMSTEKEYWDYLLQAQKSKNADQLEVATDLYLRRFPQSAKADDVLYLLATSHLQSGRWVQALSVFDRIIKDFPQGDRQASALLGKAITYKKMNIPETARGLLQELIDGYPKSREAFQARAELKVLLEQPDKVLSKKTSEQ